MLGRPFIITSDIRKKCDENPFFYLRKCHLGKINVCCFRRDKNVVLVTIWESQIRVMKFPRSVPKKIGHFNIQIKNLNISNCVSLKSPNRYGKTQKRYFKFFCLNSLVRCSCIFIYESDWPAEYIKFVDSL